MNMSQAMQAFGVDESTLTEEEKQQLDDVGFVLLRGVLTADQVAAFNARLDELLIEEGDAAGRELHQEPGTQRLADLINKDALFDNCFTHPRVLAAVRYVLGDFKLSELCSRFTMPGEGLQPLHVDGNRPVDAPGEYSVCNTFWLLDDFTPENGPTRVVPGTHRSGRGPDVADPKAAHADEVRVLAPAGTVVIFNSHLWHGGTTNTTDKRRRAISAFYCRRDHTSGLQNRSLHAETVARLNEATRYIVNA